MQKTLKEMTATWLRDGRLSKGLTQKELSERSHISMRSIQRIENGELVPRSHTLKTLAEILGLPFEDFMKAAREKEFIIPQSESTLTRPQRIVLSVGICLIILLLAWAYVAQAPNFPETTFELLVFLSTALALTTAVLFSALAQKRLTSHSNYKFLMIGILIQLALSWLLVWFFDRKNLSVLGLMPSRLRLQHFTTFLLIAAAFSASGFGLKMWIGQQRWQLNPEWTSSLIADGVWFNIKSVLYEELIFRGALFYILIKKLGATKAIWISSTAFGTYHWFSQSSLGNPMSMLITFVVTGVMGLVLAYGYTKTQSLYVPIAIHFGWNVVQQVVFSNGPIGERLLIEVLPQPEVTVSYFSFFFMQLFPIVGVLVVCAFGIRYLRS